MVSGSGMTFSSVALQMIQGQSPPLYAKAARSLGLLLHLSLLVCMYESFKMSCIYLCLCQQYKFYNREYLKPCQCQCLLKYHGNQCNSTVPLQHICSCMCNCMCNCLHVKFHITRVSLCCYCQLVRLTFCVSIFLPMLQVVSIVIYVAQDCQKCFLVIFLS